VNAILNLPGHLGELGRMDARLYAILDTQVDLCLYKIANKLRVQLLNLFDLKAPIHQKLPSDEADVLSAEVDNGLFVSFLSL